MSPNVRVRTDAVLDDSTMDIRAAEQHTLLRTENPTADTLHQFFAPYRRVDPAMTTYEYVKTAFACIFLLPVRALYLVVAGLVLMGLAKLTLLGLPPAPPARQQQQEAAESESANSESVEHGDKSVSVPISPPPVAKENKHMEQDEGNESVDFDNHPLFKPLSQWRKMLISLSFPIIRSILFVSFGIYRIHDVHRSFPPDVDARMQETLRDVRQRQQIDPSSLPPAQRLLTIDEDDDGKGTLHAESYVVVANHLGYLDILILMCRFRGSFVAKGDCETFPFVSVYARALQCLFVRAGAALTPLLLRRVQLTHECHQRRANCPGCMTCMTKLIIFSEGTTTNGFNMIPFRSGIFHTGAPVRLVGISFPHSHFNLSWETVPLRYHLFRAMTQLVNHVSCVQTPVYVPSAEEIESPKHFALNAQTQLLAALNDTHPRGVVQPVVPLNRKHKFLYHSFLLRKITSEQEVLDRAKALLDEDEQLDFYIMNSSKHKQDELV